MNLRRLKYFVKIVDIGSLTQASEVLHIAQPALSQQLATLEGEFKQQLLVRTKRGVTPTEAGRVLYRHAQIILRQFEQAQSDVRNSGRALSGQVSVGLAPGTAASALALPLLKTVRARHPDVVLYLNENFGTTLCELVSNGRMDMAVYRPSTGSWLILGSASGFTTTRTVTLGSSGDIPVPSDYDADGTTDVAVYRPATRQWTILKSTDGSVLTSVWGSSGSDVPLPRHP